MKKTLKISAVVLVLLVAFTLSVSAGGEEESYTIGMDSANLSADVFVQFVKVFEEYCDERGWKFVSSENKDDTSVQVTNLENMITAGCDAIFSQNMDPSATKDIYKRIKDEGIVLVCFDARSDVADYNFYCDNLKLGAAVGEMAGEWANENLGGKGNLVLFRVPFMDFTVKRAEGTVEGFTKACPTGAVLEVVDIRLDIMADMTENAMQAHPDANLFIYPGDAGGYIGYEIIQAEVKRRGLDESQYGIFANDGSASVLPLIAAGTIYRGTIDLGLKNQVPIAALEAIEYSLTGKGKKYPRENYFPYNYITVENAADYME